MATIRRSIDALLPPEAIDDKTGKEKHKIHIQFFPKKKQFKIFVEMLDKVASKKFFSSVFQMKQLPILNQNFEEIYLRDMRAYLVKSEAEYTRLALKRY